MIEHRLGAWYERRAEFWALCSDLGDEVKVVELRHRGLYAAQVETRHVWSRQGQTPYHGAGLRYLSRMGPLALAADGEPANLVCADGRFLATRLELLQDRCEMYHALISDWVHHHSGLAKPLVSARNFGAMTILEHKAASVFAEVVRALNQTAPGTLSLGLLRDVRRATYQSARRRLRDSALAAWSPLTAPCL